MTRVLWVAMVVVVGACGGAVPARDAGFDAGTQDAGSQDAGTRDAGPLPSVALSVNAVSVLFPLPASPSTEGLLALDAPGRGGPLLPKAHFDAIPVFADNPLDARAYPHWRVVAARLDPCFPTLAFLNSAPGKCRAQLRLVAQSSPNDASNSGVDDNAIHLLYDLPRAEWEDLARRWVQPLEGAAGARAETLGVSPTLKAQGLSGSYGTHLRALIQEFAGAGTLAQLTFMEGRGVAWEFGGFMIQGTARTPLEIFDLHPMGTMTKLAQTTGVAPGSPFSFHPGSTLSERLLPLGGRFVSDGTAGGGRIELDPAKLPAALQAALEVEDPTSAIHPDSADCSSCHLAGRARNSVERAGKGVAGLKRYTHPFRPGGTHDAEGTTEQRAFGWHRQQPIVNGRVAHESAEVADVVERLVSQGQ